LPARATASPFGRSGRAAGPDAPRAAQGISPATRPVPPAARDESRVERARCPARPSERGVLQRQLLRRTEARTGHAATSRGHARTFNRNAPQFECTAQQCPRRALEFLRRSERRRVDSALGEGSRAQFARAGWTSLRADHQLSRTG
jgi:hypothetical protein